MKYLLFAGILGFSCWMISEFIEIFSGYNATVYYLTAAYHFFAAFGIWGLYRVQKQEGNSLGKIGAVISAVAYLGLVYFPIAVMHSGLHFPAFLEANPAYKFLGGFWFLGMMMFGISLLRTKYFAVWTAVVFIVGTLLFTATPLLGLPTMLVNFTNIVFAMTVIYLCVFGLNQLNKNY